MPCPQRRDCRTLCAAGSNGTKARIERRRDIPQANGVYMKMMNFRRFDPEYASEGKVGLTRGNKDEEVVWNEFSSNPECLAAAVAAIRLKIEGDADLISSHADTPYWVFVCNPKKWAIDRFLDREIERDTWGIWPSDRSRFAPGQLGIIRVGVDRRSAAERNGKPPLEPGIMRFARSKAKLLTEPARPTSSGRRVK
jgi:hypothetical protein